MEKKDPKLSSFKAGDMQRRKMPSQRGGTASEENTLRFPFLEKLLESSEEEIESFQQKCQVTCGNLDNMMNHSKDPEITTMCQAALSAYGHSLKLFSKLLETKYEKLRNQSK